MNRLRIMGPAVALLALAACSPHHEKTEQEAAAEKKLAEARAVREGLEKEKALLTQQLISANPQADAVSTEYNRALAAASYLAGLEGSHLQLDDSMRAARVGFQFEEAARTHNPKALAALAFEVLKAELPCDEPEQEDAKQEPDHACGPCKASPYEDACVGVPERLSEWPTWECDTVARTGDSLPPAAFCRATFEHPEPVGNESSPYAQEDLPTSLAVVRVAFVHDGHLYASDWPAPSVDLYHPPNTTGRAQCLATTQQNSCAHDCDVHFDRYRDPCACQPKPKKEEGDKSNESEKAAGESPEVRKEARSAEAEVAEAKRRADEAAKELSYRECVAACKPPRPEPPPTTNEEGNPLPPPPARVKQAAHLEATPAPGVFVVTLETRKLSADGKELGTSSSTLLLEDEGLAALWSGRELPEPDTLNGLRLDVAFDEVLREGRKVSLSPLPGMKGSMLVGLSQGKVVAARFSTAPSEGPVWLLEPQDVCSAIQSEPKRFPASYQEACGKVPEKQEPASAAETEAEKDAGTSGKVTGEGTP